MGLLLFVPILFSVNYNLEMSIFVGIKNKILVFGELSYQ